MVDPELSLALTGAHFTGRVTMVTATTLCVKLSRADSPQNLGVLINIFTGPASRVSRVDNKHLVVLAGYLTTLVSRNLVLVETVEALMTVLSHKKLPRTLALAEGVVSKGAGEGNNGILLFLLASNMERTRAPPIINSTGPGMVYHVDIHNLIILTSYLC